MRKILFLSSWYPFPPDNGARTRVYNIVRYLAKEYEVSFVAFSPKGTSLQGLDFCSNVMTVDQNLLYIKPREIELIHFFLPHPIVSYPVKKMQQLVDSILQKDNYSGLVSFTSIMGSYLISKDIPKVLDVDAGLTSFAMQRYRLEKTRLGKWRAWVSMKKAIDFEQRIIGQFDAVVALTKLGLNEQKPIFKKAKKLAIIGNGVDLNYYHFNSEEPKPDTLIYNGSLTFSANYDAMKWFLQKIYPIVKEKIPSVQLRITGSYENINLDLFTMEGVVLTGYIPDVRSVVAKSWICVVPIRIGGGQRMKILEAMALGTPVVSTSRGIEGIEIQAGEHAIIADEAEDFAKAIVLLLQDDQKRREIAHNARILVEQKYDWETILPRFNSLIGSVLKKPR